MTGLARAMVWWLLGIGVVALVWLVTSTLIGDTDVLPEPGPVIAVLWQDAPKLLASSWETARAALLGLVVAVVFTHLLATAIGLWPRLQEISYPTLISLKAVPVVAFIPLIVGILGGRLLGRSSVSALIAFFPLVVSALDGMALTPRRLLLLCEGCGATRRRTYRAIIAPYAYVGFLTGLKTAAPLSVVGAIVAEYMIGGSSGLGAMLMGAYTNSNMLTVMAAAIASSGIASVFFALSSIALSYARFRFHIVE